MNQNRVLAGMFARMADILEFRGENAFKVNAYRKAARTLGDLAESVAYARLENRLKDIPGIGDALASKISEFLDTGRIAKYDEVASSVPEGLMDLLRIPGLGPKTLALLHKSLSVANLTDLKAALDDGSLAQLPGLGKKKEDNIRRGIDLLERHSGRIPLGEALPVAESVMEALLSGVRDLHGRWISRERMSCAGSLRRMCETIGDIDILVESDDGSGVAGVFVGLPMVSRVLAQGETKASVIVEDGLQIDLRVVPEGSYGAALQYFTGSKAHNVRLREIGRKLGFKINEYGIFRNGKRIGGRTEEDLYRLIGTPWIPPELREDRGEIEAATSNALPRLVEPRHVRGDLHVHTKWSDGSADILTMAKKAESLGYQFVAVCDHSTSVTYAGGLSPDRLVKQVAEIRRINRKMKSCRILAGTEVDVLADGSLDYSDDLLRRLDFVVASVHSGFKNRVTERLIAAAKNPHVTVLGHPTGRLIGEREGYEVDTEAVMRACAESGTAMEINAYYLRLDLNDVLARRAKELGVRISLGTDAHHPDQMDMMRYGLAMARRAWLEKRDVLNCMRPEKLLAK
jgi:DNA polymerase (family 10)